MASHSAPTELLRAHPSLAKRRPAGPNQASAQGPLQPLSTQMIQRLQAHHAQAGTPAAGQAAPSPANALPAQDVLTMQRLWGNRTVQRIVDARNVDARNVDAQDVAAQGPAMTVDEDPAAEQRAQRAADAALSGEGRVGSITPLRRREIKRQAAEAGQGASSRGGTVDGTTAQAIENARGRGQPLDQAVRGEMEARLGVNLQGVRVHTDAQADRLSRSLDATAFTTQRDIFFRRGQYAPQTAAGKHLLAHELTHVVQQGGGVQRQAAKQGLIQRARGKSYIPGAATARDSVFGERDDRRKMPSDLTPNFLAEIEMTPLAIPVVERRFLRKNKVHTLRGQFYQHRTVNYNGTTVLVLSGSGGSSEQYTRQMAEKYCRTGARVVAVNYRGYGESSDTTPTEAKLYNDAMAIYQAVVNGAGGMPRAVNPADIVVHGYSMGGPVAATLVKRILKKGGNVKGLVLDRAMTSTYEAAREEVNPLMAFGAKLGVGSMSVKSKLKSIHKHNPNLPIVFTSAGTDSSQVTDTSMDADIEAGSSMDDTLKKIRLGDTRGVDNFVNELKSDRMSKDGLALNDRRLAQWAINKGMNVSEVNRDNLSHFSQTAMMDELIPELSNRGLLNDSGGGIYQNASNLKRPSVQNVIDEVQAIKKLMALPRDLENLEGQLARTGPSKALNRANGGLKRLIERQLPAIKDCVDAQRGGDQQAYLTGMALARTLHNRLLAGMRSAYIALAQSLLGITIPATATTDDILSALRPLRASSDAQKKQIANNMLISFQLAIGIRV